MRESFSRQSLSIPGMLRKVRQCFAAIPDNPGHDISLVDHLMSGMAVFGLKYPSLLKFDKDRTDEAKFANLQALYGIKRAPCDTRLRERLDELDPSLLRPAYKKLFAEFQRGKGLENFSYIDGHYLLSLDGTGYFSSQNIHCEQCCEKKHRNGTTTYYHQMLGAVLVHPDNKEVIPLAPEPILKQDGATKNDCERNAAKRLLSDVRREHPHLKIIAVEDGLSSNGPHIRQLKEHDMRFILGVKPDDHKFLFNWVNSVRGVAEHVVTDEKGFTHRFRYLNNVPLNDASFDLEVNFFEYWETSPKGKVTHFSWVTDFTITPDNLMKLMRGGRARWKIENETFNTLKNHGYNFEHNFGHGNKNLSTVLMHLMMLSFLIDQIQQRCCRLFQAAMVAAERKSYFWCKLRGIFDVCLIPDWETLYRFIIKKQLIPITMDTS